MISPHCDIAGIEECGVVGMDICMLAGFTEAILSCIFELHFDEAVRLQ